MAHSDNATAAGRRSAAAFSARTTAGTLLGVFIALAASGVAMVWLRHRAGGAHETVARLHQLSAHLQAVDAAEWRALVEQRSAESLKKLAEHRQAAGALAATLSGAVADLRPVKERFAAYNVVLDAELEALAAGDLERARDLDRTSVDPSFDALIEVLDQASANYDRIVGTTIQRTDQLTVLVLVTASLVIGLLLWRWLSLRARSDVLRETALALRGKEAELSEAQRVSRIGSWDWELSTGRVGWSAELYRVLRRDPDGAAPLSIERLACYTAESTARLTAALEELRAHGTSYALDLEVLTTDDTPRWLLARGEPTLDPAGAVVGLHGTIQDITERKGMEAGLRRRESILHAVSLAAEQFLRTGAWRTNITEVLAALGCAAGADRVVIFENRTAADGDILVSQRHEWCGPGLTLRADDLSLQNIPLRTWGYARWTDLLGRGEIIAADVRDLPAAEQPALAGHGIRSVAVVPVFAGSEWWGFIGLDACFAERRWSPVELDALSAAARLLGEAVRREREEKSRERLESQLLHAQKMEAVGQLAGGVAHDFNNLLTVILGNASLLDDCASNEEETRRLAGAITESANRAARLTAQLLAFSRRQLLQRRHLDLNDIVVSHASMLGRLLGEHITVQTRYAPGLPLIHADESMIGQIIMNLAVNARDAMADGGTLTISTELVTVEAMSGPVVTDTFDGQAVVLSVSDTGCGMDHVTRTHIFEPFFTTKPFGQGTGLGLSTVYGIVKQHDGWIEVHSESGQGATFRVYFPIGGAPVDRVAQVEPEKPASVSTGTILLVEDEPAVREVTAALLRKRGYEVLEAGNGPEAIAIWRDCGGRVDLLFTDMVMPAGMSGRDLAAALRREKRDLKVITCSGYSQEPGDPTTAPAANDGYLQKPYTTVSLLDAVRHHLDRAH